MTEGGGLYRKGRSGDKEQDIYCLNDGGNVLSKLIGLFVDSMMTLYIYS